MEVFDVGRVCTKTTGKDAGKKCAVVEVIDQNYVLVDGDVKRKRCNIKHLKPTANIIKIKKGATSILVAPCDSECKPTSSVSSQNAPKVSPKIKIAPKIKNARKNSSERHKPNTIRSSVMSLSDNFHLWLIFNGVIVFF